METAVTALCIARVGIARVRTATALLGLSILATPAFAQETIDIGTIRNDDITVVQRLLYPKAGRAEIGLHVGVIPFDPYVLAPNAQVSYAQHLNERVALSLVAGVGWGFKTSVYRQLESPTYGVAPAAYGYLGAALGGIEWSPIYAKLNLNGARIVHFDVYVPLRAGLTVERSVVPGGGLAFAPTASPGLGFRLFLGKAGALKVELRDDLLFEYRPITETFFFKQNANLTVGLVVMTGKGGRS